MLNITFCHFSWLHSFLHVLHPVNFPYEELHIFFLFLFSFMWCSSFFPEYLLYLFHVLFTHS